MKYLCAAETYFEFFVEFKYYQYYSKGDSSNPTSIMFSGAPPGLVMLAAPPQPVSDLQVSLHIRVGKFHGPTYLSWLQRIFPANLYYDNQEKVAKWFCYFFSYVSPWKESSRVLFGIFVIEIEESLSEAERLRWT